MNEEHLEDYIKKAVTEEMQSHFPPDLDKVWQKIENTIDLFERLQLAPKKKHKITAGQKITALLVTLVLAAVIIGFSHIGEAVPFGWIFQGLKKVAGDDFVLVQYKYGEETTPDRSTPPPPPEADQEGTISYQTNLRDTSLGELPDLYPGVLYYPRDIAERDLVSAQYLQAGEKWIILLDFLVDRRNILFQQEDIVGRGAAGIGYSGDTEVSFRRLEGVEYMVAELRYGIVNIRWTKENKLFELTCNLPAEEALSTAQSVAPYH